MDIKQRVFFNLWNDPTEDRNQDILKMYALNTRLYQDGCKEGIVEDGERIDM